MFKFSFFTWTEVLQRSNSMQSERLLHSNKQLVLVENMRFYLIFILFLTIACIPVHSSTIKRSTKTVGLQQIQIIPFGETVRFYANETWLHSKSYFNEIYYHYIVYFTVYTWMFSSKWRTIPECQRRPMCGGQIAGRRQTHQVRFLLVGRKRKQSRASTILEEFIVYGYGNLFVDFHCLFVFTH